MSEAPRDRSSVLAQIALVKKNVAQARDESIAARTPVAPSPASSVPATPRSEASADFVNFVDPRSMRRHQRHSNLPESLQQRHHFIDTWASKIEAFVWDNTRMVMELPTDLQGADRKALHQLANEYNLSHHSSTVNGLRRLVLKKDDLFFAKNLHKPDDEQIRKLKEERGIRHNRREEEEVVPEKKKYADQNVYKAFKTFHKATDAYAKAVETGYQIEDEAAFVAPPAQPANARHTGAGISEQSVGWSAALSSNEDVHNSAAMATLKDAADRGDLFEVCTVCGARQQVDYDPSRWECIGPCEACQTDRIWRLETKAGAVMEAPSTSKPQDANRTKRERPVEASVDEETRPPALSVEEVVQLAELHNMPAPVVKWIRAFAESRERNGATDDHVLFCMDFSDFDRYLPRPQADSRLYFYRVLHHEATKCINKILVALDQRGRPEPVPADDQATANRSTAIQDVYVGFPGMDIDLEGGSPMRLLVGVFTHGSLDETTARLAANDVNTGLNVTHAVKCGLTVSEALSE